MHRRPAITTLMPSPSHTADALTSNRKLWPGTITMYSQPQVRVSILYRYKCQHSGNRRIASGNLNPVAWSSTRSSTPDTAVLLLDSCTLYAAFPLLLYDQMSSDREVKNF